MTHFLPFAQVTRDLGWPQILAALAQRARTERGKLRAAALPFLDSREEIEASLTRIEEARGLLRRELAIPLGAVADVGGALERAGKGAVLPPDEILAAAELIRAAAAVRRFMAAYRQEAPHLGRTAAGLAELSPLAARIDAAFEPSGQLKDTASDALASYRGRARGLHREIKERVEGMLHDTAFAEYLQDSYYSVRNDRYVVPIKASCRSRVPGLVHNASQSGQTLFVEPQQLVDLGNELSIAESLAAEEERQVLAELSAYLGDRAADLADSLERLAELDLVQASARLAEQLDAAPPVIHEGPELHLAGARHPLMLLQGKPVVGNTVRLGPPQRVLVVSGPNAGGKTVTLGTTGLCVLMARAGLPLPARDGSRLPLYRGLCSAIGDAQDLARDLSTFSAHLTALKEILAHAGEGWLALIDEIGADTDPKEGAALAAATLEELAEHGAQVLVTTHLDEIKALGLIDERFGNGRMGFDRGTLRPTYELELGAAGVSNAIEVAHQVGMPARIVERARERLQSGGALSVAIARLEEERQALGVERRTAARERLELEAARNDAELARDAAEKARRDALSRVREELAEEIEAARTEVRGIIAGLQAAGNLQAAERAQKRLAERAAQLERQQARLAAEAEVPAGAQPRVAVGSRVRVVSLNQVGEILAVDDEAAVVALGTLRSRVPLADVVALPGKASARGWAEKRRPEQMAARALETPAVRCDVRGMRADEATREIELFLDRTAISGPGEVVIVHGHGTGALKRVVREALARLPYVGGFRPGETHEGGDGVTVVELRT